MSLHNTILQIARGDMSEWYKPEKEDIEIDQETNEVNIWVKANDWGNVYATLTFDQIKEIAEKIDGNS